MNKIVVTNNPKATFYEDLADIVFLENKSVLAVLKEGLNVATKGGTILVDPTKVNLTKTHYKSIPFFKNGEGTPNEKSVELIKTAIVTLEKAGLSETLDKEPLMAGIKQKGDMESLEKIIG